MSKLFNINDADTFCKLMDLKGKVLKNDDEEFFKLTEGLIDKDTVQVLPDYRIGCRTSSSESSEVIFIFRPVTPEQENIEVVSVNIYGSNLR